LGLGFYGFTQALCFAHLFQEEAVVLDALDAEGVYAGARRVDERVVSDVEVVDAVVKIVVKI
jgi:hypothetical protein